MEDSHNHNIIVSSPKAIICPVSQRLGSGGAQEISQQTASFTLLPTKAATTLPNGGQPGVLFWTRPLLTKGFKHIDTGLWRFGKSGGKQFHPQSLQIKSFTKHLSSNRTCHTEGSTIALKVL